MTEKKPQTPFSNEVRKWVTGEGPMPVHEEIIPDQNRAAYFFQTLEKRLRFIGLELQGSKVLEIGTGTGSSLKYLNKQGIDAVGIDARPRHKEDLPVAQARAEQLPFKDETFDVVLSAWVLDSSIYHQDQLRILEEIARVLKQGGVYVGFEPYRDDIEVAGFTKIVDPTDPRPPVFRKN